MPASTPRRAGRTPRAGSRYLSDVLADNLRAWRLLRRLEQAEVARRMTMLDHAWGPSTVSQVERGRRNVTVDELLALAIALGVPAWVLLDPLGPEGDNDAPVDFGPVGTLAANLVRDWLTANAVPRFDWSDPGGDAPPSGRLFIGGPPAPPADGAEDGGAS
jgi:transcriptional regulator with XRE-family HTH domain